MSALDAAAIPYELVPGVSSALAAPLFAGVPLTHVSLSPSFTVVSGHDVAGTDWVSAGRALLGGYRPKGRAGDCGLLHSAWSCSTPSCLVAHSLSTNRCPLRNWHSRATAL